MNTVGFLTIEPNYYTYNEPLLNHLMYFDKLLVSTSSNQNEKIMKHSGYEELYKKKRLEMEELMKYGLIEELTYVPKGNKKLKPNTGFIMQIEVLNALKKILNPFIIEGNKKYLNTEFLNAQMYTRYISARLNRELGDKILPIIYEGQYLFENIGCIDQTNAFRITVKNFPRITQFKYLEQFVDFKKDPETKIKLARLRNWIVDITTDKYKLNEIEQKMEYLLMDYGVQMRIHKLITDLNVVETILIPSSDGLENIAKLNWSPVAKSTIYLKKLRLTLSAAEKDSIGKEIAYIHLLTLAHRLRQLYRRNDM